MSNLNLSSFSSKRSPHVFHGQNLCDADVRGTVTLTGPTWGTKALQHSFSAWRTALMSQTPTIHGLHVIHSSRVTCAGLASSPHSISRGWQSPEEPAQCRDVLLPAPSTRPRWSWSPRQPHHSGTPAGTGSPGSVDVQIKLNGS